jgi:hypothetical protein
MTAALSMLIILAIAVWFYQTAQQRGLPGVAWAVGGVIVYYGGFLLWMHGVLRQVLGGLFQSHNFGIAIAMDLTSILFGALCAVLFRFKVMLKQGGKPSEPSV